VEEGDTRWIIEYHYRGLKSRIENIIGWEWVSRLVWSVKA